MPLLNKKQFKRNSPPSSLQPDDKVFYCELTNEVFTDYDEFWERLVLCNAMVWTCEMTGKANLTFEEALESEQKARKCLAKISPALHTPLLYLTSLTKRSKYSDMNDDVFNYTRDRYFVGEPVEAIVNNHWYDCKVIGIVAPTLEEVAKYEIDMADSDDEEEEEETKKEVNGTASDGDSDIMIVDEVKNTPEGKKPKSKDKNNPDFISAKMKEINIHSEDYPPYATVKYEVQEIDPWDYKTCQKHLVSWEQIRRNKGAFTREKCKLYLKQCVETGPDGLWSLKKSVTNKYNINSTKFSDIFTGNTPKFAQSKAKKVAEPKIKEKKEKKEKKEREKKENNEEKKKGRATLTEEEKFARKVQKDNEKEKIREELRLRIEKEKVEKKKEKEVKKEEKRLLDLLLKEWGRVREDLDCEDHKNIPSATPIQCRIPNEHFGEFMMVLEFMTAFSETVELKDVYPVGITFDMLEHALVEKEVAGLFNDILQLLLGAIFNLQEQEDEEVGDTTSNVFVSNDERECKDQLKLSEMQKANKAALWPQRYQGASLQKVPLDALTLTEILRLHLLASGATNVANSLWRHNYRGGFKVWDDPGMQLKFDKPEVIHVLGEKPVFDLSIGEKLQIVSVLMNQILTYASVRDIIDDSLDKVRETRNELRLHKYAEIKQEREDNAAIRLKIKEDKQRKIDQLIKNMEKKAEGMNSAEIDAEEEEQKRVNLEIEEKNRERRKQELMKKEQELLTHLRNVSKNVNLMPLGEDRAYRRYWMFDSLDGLFVEDNEDNPGLCREQATRKTLRTNPQDSEFVKEKIRAVALKNIEALALKEKEEKSASDKENDGSLSPAKQNINNKNLLKSANHNDVDFVDKAPTEVVKINGEVKPELEISEVDYEICNGLGEDLDTDIFGLCNADSETCFVHNKSNIKSRPCWLFYNNTDEFESLLNSLNSRGLRESQLKEALISNKSQIEVSLNRCPVYKLDPTKDPETDKSLRKSQRGNKKEADSNLNFPLGTPIVEIFESTIRDLILEMEEKLTIGSLGNLKVPDLEVWRSAVSDGHSTLTLDDADWGGKNRLYKLKQDLGVELSSDLEDSRTKDEITGAEITSRDTLIETLALTILQVSQSIEVKYLKPPLEETAKAAAKRKKVENKLGKQVKKQDGSESESESDEEEKDKITNVREDDLRTPLERWEKSLMASTSLSQLFLHLATLDNSITWSRSAVNARCRICRKKSDPDNMLLCDGCDKGHHMYCLKPKLKSVPTGDWFCDRCKPKEKPKSPQKKRRIYKEVSEDEESEDEEEEEQSRTNSEEEIEECEVCNKGETELQCGTCYRLYHLDCADVRKVPRGTFTCSLCKSSPPRNKEKKSSPNNKKQPVKAQSKKRKPPPVEEERPAKRQRHEPEEVVVPRSSRRSLVDENSLLNAGAQETILQELCSHELGWPFLKPVSKKVAPDYYNVVKKPMDFRTVHNKMNNMKYQTDSEFIADVLLVFQNCQQYNVETTEEYKCGIRLCKYFRKRVKELGLHTDKLVMNGLGS